MPEWLVFLFHDAQKGWEELRPTDFAQPSFIALWGVMLIMPLVGIDRRDAIAGLVYILFCVAAGAMLAFALPKQYVPDPSFRTMFSTLLVMAGIAGTRWFNPFVSRKVAVKVKGVKSGEQK